MNGQLEAYDAGVKSATIAVSSSRPVQCSPDGQQFVYIDANMGNITKVDIASGVSQWLASYEVPKSDRANASLSPNLQTVATDRPLKLTAQAGSLKIISVNASGK